MFPNLFCKMRIPLVLCPYLLFQPIPILPRDCEMSDKEAAAGNSDKPAKGGIFAPMLALPMPKESGHKEVEEEEGCYSFLRPPAHRHTHGRCTKRLFLGNRQPDKKKVLNYSAHKSLLNCDSFLQGKTSEFLPFEWADRFSSYKRGRVVRFPFFAVPFLGNLISSFRPMHIKIRYFYF